ncbi:hypothetical protein D3C81_1133330 [compost metagenome]
MLTQPPRKIWVTSSASATHAAQRSEAACGVTGCGGSLREPSTISDDSSAIASSRWVTTMIGWSFIVTVSAPNKPCTQTSTNTPVANHGDCFSSRRLTHASTISEMISTPTAMAK